MAVIEITKNFEVITLSRREAVDLIVKLAAQLEPVYLDRGQVGQERLLQSPMLAIKEERNRKRKVMFCIDPEAK